MAHEDINFVHSLHAQANARSSWQVDFIFILIFSFFVGFITWAYFSKIDELARGQGKVIPAKKIQTIQSLDGGIIKEILVKEGQHVKEGQLLMKIDTTRFRATYEENIQKKLSYIATIIRLDAEANIDPVVDIPILDFPVIIKENAPNFVKAEQAVFEIRVSKLKTSLKVLESQLAQKLQELVEIESKIKLLKKSIELKKETLKIIKKAVKSRSKSRTDLLNAKEELNRTKADLDAAMTSIPRAKYAISEAKQKVAEKLKEFKSEASKEMQKIEAQLKEVDSKLIADKDKLAKTDIVSSVDGYIKTININTIGGVVKSGADLIEIVPKSEKLLVEAKIDPKDIAFINPSQKAVVKITAYDYSIYGGLEGKIVEISADSIIDKDSKDKKAYYRVLVRTDKNYLEKDNKKLPIIPGMVASIDIVTGQKTILDFLLKPILKTKQGALHER
jgi:adhesin transport system membrane fusion protein